MKDLHELFPRSKGFDGDYSISVGVLDVSHSMLNYDSIIFTAAVVLSVSLWRKLWAAWVYGCRSFIHMHAPQSVSAVTLTVTWIKQNVS